MNDYKLQFISNQDIYNHVKETVLQYSTYINLETFNKNIIDPIKLTFDSKIYKKTFEEIIESECIRQIDKSNTNLIGYFHQNIFKYAKKGWEIPKQGFDIINNRKHIFVEMKNKHNTMNSTSSQGTYIRMQNKLLEDNKAICMLVEVIAKKSQNIPWECCINGQTVKNEKIRRVSIDQFYNIVFNKKNLFYKLCNALPVILDDVISDIKQGIIGNEVIKELKEISSDTFKSLYLLAFKTYEGFSIQK